jgi:DNA-binding response OmpR family regulator
MSIKQPHLLLVDDDQDLAEIFRESLMDLSFKVTIAGSGLQALELFKQNTYDGVISDVMMPQMSGVELVSHLRQLKNQVPVYFITGYLDYSRETLNSLKPRAIIFKPFDVEEAAMLIKNHFLKEFSV